MPQLSSSTDFTDLLDYLYNLQRLGIKVGLSHTIELLKRCGNPQDTFQSIHVAGTNGKGSTCAMTAAILMAAGPFRFPVRVCSIHKRPSSIVNSISCMSA